jgi:hypothetical protein
MRTVRKYAFVLALSLAVIFVYAPLRLEDAMKFPWLDDISVIIHKCLAPAKPEVGVCFMHPIAPAKVNDDLVLGLAETVDYKDRTTAAIATEGSFSSVPPRQVVSTVAPAHALRWRAAKAQNRTHWSFALRSVQLRRHANRWTGRGLPPILLALLGEGPRDSITFRQTRAPGGRGGANSAGVGSVVLLLRAHEPFRLRALSQTLVARRMPSPPLPGKECSRGGLTFALRAVTRTTSSASGPFLADPRRQVLRGL